jgi:hypothetical protein
VEVIEEYEEEVLVQEEVPEPPVTDSVDATLAPRQAPMYNPYFWNTHYIYMLCTSVVGVS